MDILDPAAQPRIQVTAYGITDVGLERKNNEDAFHIEERAGLYVVCDGMGGHASGELASRLTVEHMVQFVTTTLLEPGFRWPFDTPEATVVETRILDSAVRLANRAVHAAATGDERHKGMGTTLVALLVGTHQIGVSHVGDSRVYRLRGGELIQLTDDHSLLNHYIKTRNLTAEQIRTFKGKNVIVRAIGLRDAVQPELQVVDAQAGDVLMLCSDGLTDLVADELILPQMVVGLRDLQQGTEALIKAALDRGGRDNVTVVMLRIGETGEGGKVTQGKLAGDLEDTSPGFDSVDQEGSWDQETLPNYEPIPSIIVRGSPPAPAFQPIPMPPGAGRGGVSKPATAAPAMGEPSAGGIDVVDRDTPMAMPAVARPPLSSGAAIPPPPPTKTPLSKTPPHRNAISAGFDSRGTPIPLPPTNPGPSTSRPRGRSSLPPRAESPFARPKPSLSDPGAPPAAPPSVITSLAATVAPAPQPPARNPAGSPPPTTIQPPPMPPDALQNRGVQVPAGDVGSQSSTVGAPITRVAATSMATAPYEAVVLPPLGAAPIIASPAPSPQAAIDVFTAPTRPMSPPIRQPAGALHASEGAPLSGSGPSRSALASTSPDLNPHRHDPTDPMDVMATPPPFAVSAATPTPADSTRDSDRDSADS